MSTILVDTGILKKNIDSLIDEKKYFYGKKSVFTRASYGASGLLSKYLLKVNQIYSDISSNIENLSNYLNDYVNDIDGLENILSSKGGYVKADEVSNLVYKNKNSIRLSFIDEGNLFNVVSYTANSGSTVNYDEVNPIKRGFATAGISALAFGEGIINVGEMVIDGVGSAASGVCSIFGSDATADSIMNFVEKDISGDIYHKVVSATGLDKYGNPDGAAAGIARIAGNIVGMAVLTVASVGVGNLIGGGLAASGAVSASTGGMISTGVTMGLNGTMGAFRDAGSEAEQAMMRGATTKEALQVSGNAATIGFVTDAIAGKVAKMAEGAKGIGSIIGYGLASFGVRSSDPVLNELSHTAVYDHDNNLTFLENFIQNAKDNNLIMQMGMAGTAGSLSTIWTGIKGLKNFNNLSEKIEVGNVKVSNGEKAVIEIKKLEDINPKLLEQMEHPESFIIKIGEKNYSGSDLVNLFGQKQTNIIQEIVLDKARNLVPEFKEAKNLSDVYEIAANILGSKIKTITDNIGFKAAADILTGPLAIYGRIKSVDVLSSTDFSNKILNEGLYHITSEEAANLILDSGYVKASGHMASYGAKKSYFFAGSPVMDDVAINVDKFSPKFAAVKFDIDESQLSALRYRACDDCAVTHLGDFQFDKNKASLVYLGLSYENGSYVYKEISKAEYDNYDINVNIGRTISKAEYMASGFARQFDYTMKRLDDGYKMLLEKLGIGNNGVETSSLGDVKKSY